MPDTPIQMTMFSDYEVIKRVHKGWHYVVAFDARICAYLARYEYPWKGWQMATWEWVYEMNPNAEQDNNNIRPARFETTRDAIAAIEAKIDRRQEQDA